MIAYTKRFFRGARFLHDFLRREDLGRVYHVRAIYLQSWLSDPNAPMVWRLQGEKTGTGTLGDLGSHITDLAQFLVGDTITRVTGMMKTFVTQRPSATDAQKKETVDVDDAVMFGAEFKNGAMGVFQASRNATGRPDHWRIEIDAEKGAVIYDSVDRSVRLSLREGPARRAGWVELQIPNRYGAEGSENQNEIDYFVECIRSGQTPAPSFADGLQVERVLDAVVCSSRTGAAVDLEA
jgi:predicted dehydrogenase